MREDNAKRFELRMPLRGIDLRKIPQCGIGVKKFLPLCGKILSDGISRAYLGHFLGHWKPHFAYAASRHRQSAAP